MKQLPEKLSARSARIVWSEIVEAMWKDRPRVVLDLSSCKELSHPVAFVLLHTLEEAMKRNGDVRLAARGEVHQALVDQGYSRLFDLFETRDEAVKSFQRSLRETA